MRTIFNSCKTKMILEIGLQPFTGKGLTINWDAVQIPV